MVVVRSMLDRKNGSQSECNWTREKTVYGLLSFVRLAKSNNPIKKNSDGRIGVQLLVQCLMLGRKTWVRWSAIGYVSVLCGQ